MFTKIVRCRWQHFNKLSLRILQIERNSIAQLNYSIYLMSHDNISKVCPLKPYFIFKYRYSSSMLHVRFFSQSRILSCQESSKVEETLEVLKEKIKQPKEVPQSVVKVVPTEKPPILTRIINELKHYYHGFRLLFLDVKLCIKHLKKVVKGQPLMRRERKQLVRTTADMFRLVPFLVFILVPFAEFALPFFVKMFPGLLPSTFNQPSKDAAIETSRTRLKLKLEMAKFLQDTIEDTALKRNDGTVDNAKEFVSFMDKIRSSGGQTSNEEIMKYITLFEDKITLDNLESGQLRALCKLVEISPIGPSAVLRFQLEMKLRQLAADDKLIQAEGVESMEIWELQEACKQRGMRSFGVPEDRLKLQLNQWLDLHLNQKIPTSLLLLSRTLYLPEHLSHEDQLKATLSVLPETITKEATVKISEVTGDRVDNKSKLELLKQEEKMIEKENEEIELLEKQKMADTIATGVSTEKIEPDLIPVEKPSVVAEPVIEEISRKDVEHLEDVLEHVAEMKLAMQREVEDLKELKEDIKDYNESFKELQDVIQSTPDFANLKESKSATRLGKKLQKLVDKIDKEVVTIKPDTKAKTDPAAVAGDSFGAGIKEEKVIDIAVDLTEKRLVEESARQISIAEILDAMNKTASSPEARIKIEKIASYLDDDKDGFFNYDDAMKLMELLGSENVTINPEQITEIITMFKKEKSTDCDSALIPLLCVHG